MLRYPEHATVWTAFTCIVDSRTNANEYDFIFFFNDTATTEIYTLSLHDALPIFNARAMVTLREATGHLVGLSDHSRRSEEHTSELQSRFDLVCRLLLEKKKLRAGWTEATVRGMHAPFDERELCRRPARHRVLRRP